MRTALANSISCPDEILLRAEALFCAERSELSRDVLSEKIDLLRSYDVLAMERVVAIVSWGRSGSLLLASYLDGHDDVLMLPELCGQGIYSFFDRYRSLPLRDKLIAFPVSESDYPGMFESAFAVSPGQYYVAVQAILEFYGNWPREFLESRRAFFLFVHIAYSMALGRRPASSHPLIVYAQHEWSDVIAASLAEDFPQAKFVHAVRDPISSCDRMFHFLLGQSAVQFPRTYVLAPYSAVCCLSNKDRPHFKMESRTRAIRFEDLHCDTAETMRALSDWIALPYQATLVDSTFNEKPYLITRDGNTWSGRRLEQVQRQSQHLSQKDRALLFTLFYENFVEWDYSCPRAFRNPIVRFIVFASLFLFPLKMEIIAARAVFKRRILPSIRRGDLWLATRSLGAVGFCRLKIIGLIAPVFLQRCAHPAALLQVHREEQSIGPEQVAEERRETLEVGGS
jgi:hypothetical protein